jgi:adenosine deaminase CECR1
VTQLGSHHAPALDTRDSHSFPVGVVDGIGNSGRAKCQWHSGTTASQRPREADRVGKDTSAGCVSYNLLSVKSKQTELTSLADHIFRQSLSPTAKRADEIVQAIRQHEIDNYWRVAATDGQKERFAGQAFPLARPYISNTTLWKVVKQMPKGALLHAHLSAMLPYDKIVKIIIQTEGMVISASQPLDTKEAKQNATFTFAHNNGTLSTTPFKIDASDYIPNTEVPVKTAVANFEGGEAAFIDFIKSKTTIPPGESIRHELGVDEIWRRFQACFGPTGSMIQYEPVVRKFYQTLFQDLASDGISWVEIRTGGSHGKLVHNGDEEIDPDLDAWWHVLVEEIDKFKATELGKSKNFLGARVIWSDTRINNRASITKSMANQSHYHKG